MTMCITFHSEQIQTGKTTLACNLAAMLASRGHTVSLLDADVYAPSLHTYFDKSVNKWVNDYFLKDAEPKDIMVDMTDDIDKLVSTNPNCRNYSGNRGKLWVGFSNPKPMEISTLHQTVGMFRRADISGGILRKIVELRKELFGSKFNSSYIIIDVGAGLTYWPLTFLALADTILLTLKFSEVNIYEIKRQVADFYNSYMKFGARLYVILNRLASHCSSIIPYSPKNKIEGISPISQMDEIYFVKRLSHLLRLDILSTIHCYRDVPFSEKEFLTAMRYPHHPFAKEIEQLASAKEIKVHSSKGL